MEKKSVDVLKIVIHLIFGLVLGAAAGFGFGVLTWGAESQKAMILFTVGGALVFGILAATIFDQFWESLPVWVDWLWPW